MLTSTLRAQFLGKVAKEPQKQQIHSVMRLKVTIDPAAADGKDDGS